MSRKKAAEIMNTRVSAVSFYTLKHLELQSCNRKTTITHNNFRHCRVKVLLVLKTTFLETAIEDQWHKDRESLRSCSNSLALVEYHNRRHKKRCVM